MENESGFLYFKPSDYSNKFDSRPKEPSILLLYGVSTLIENSISCCTKLKVENDTYGYYFLKDCEYPALSKSVLQLAKHGYEKRRDMHWVPLENRETAEFEDYSIFDWATYGLSKHPRPSVTDAQIHGICALWDVESAVSAFLKDGWCANVTHLLLSAAFLESEGRECQGAEHTKRLREKIKSTAQNAISNMARNISIARHMKSPKAAERKMVYECWQNWQKNPKQFRSKAGFARSMLDKCEHLTSQKKIEDWCRLWEASAKTLTVPVE